MTLAFAILDVDDVILDMDRLADRAARSVRGPLALELGEDLAERVTADFVAAYGVLRAQLRSKPGARLPSFVDLLGRIEGWQRGLLAEGYEPKPWSRHSLLAIALENRGVPVTARLLHGAVDHYWTVLAEETRILPDARATLDRLAREGVPVHLATNSDGFLRLDEAAQTFRYDPGEAVRLKLKRLGAIAEVGLSARDVSVGDPVGKPSRAFYERVLEEFSSKIGLPIDRARTLAVGDSLTHDVLPLLDLGVRRGAWLLRDRDRPGPERHESDARVVVIKDLRELEFAKWDL